MKLSGIEFLFIFSMGSLSAMESGERTIAHDLKKSIPKQKQNKIRLRPLRIVRFWSFNLFFKHMLQTSDSFYLVFLISKNIALW